MSVKDSDLPKILTWILVLMSLCPTSNAFVLENNSKKMSFTSAWMAQSIIADEELNQRRKQNSIDCKHFQDGKCAGCVVNSHVEDVDIVKSAKLYFSSSSIRNYHTSTSKNHQKGDDNDDDFYKVVIPSPLTQWRTQAKLAVAPKSSWGRDGCIFGLFERGSHKVMPIPECAVHHPSINRAVEVLTQATSKVGTPAFQESNENGGGLRYIQLQVERLTGKVCLTLIWHAENLKGCQPALSRLIKESKRIDPHLWHSIWCHTNDSFGNAIFSRNQNSWHPMNGPEFVREPLPGTDIDKKEGLVFFSPTAFRQGNMDGFEVIAQHVATAIPGGSRVCELYAGVGILGLTALNYHHPKSTREEEDDDDSWWDEDNEESEKLPLKWLRCSDENPANPRLFQKTANSMPNEVTGRSNSFKYNQKKSKGKGRSGASNKKKDSGDLTMKELMEQMMNEEYAENISKTNMDTRKGKVSYMVASAARALYEGQALGADVIVVDPPRKGLEEEVLNQLCKAHNPNQDYTEDAVLLQSTYAKHAINWVNDAHTLIYVSCGFDALARDCDALLTSNGGWELESTTGYILFPGTNHVETVAIFKRAIQ